MHDAYFGPACKGLFNILLLFRKAWLERVIADRERQARRPLASRMVADRHHLAQWLRPANPQNHSLASAT
jgi:hypothetical protein